MRYQIALALMSLVVVAHGQDTRSERRLLASLTRTPGSLSLLARYAELRLPCEGAATRAATTTRRKSAIELLRRMERAASVPSDASSVPDVELERRLTLHAAHAEALLGRYDESLQHLNAAARRQDPFSASCARQVAALAVADDRLEPATDALTVANQALPQDASARAELARVWLARGRIDRALPLLAERFAGATAELPARSELAYALAADGRAEEALRLLEPAREACEADAVCALTAGRIALEAGRFEDALRFLRARLDQDASDLDALFALGDLHARAKQPERAREAYQQILQLRPQSVRASQALEGLTPH